MGRTAQQDPSESMQRVEHPAGIQCKDTSFHLTNVTNSMYTIFTKQETKSLTHPEIKSQMLRAIFPYQKMQSCQTPFLLSQSMFQGSTGQHGSLTAPAATRCIRQCSQSRPVTELLASGSRRLWTECLPDTVNQAAVEGTSNTTGVEP